MCGVAQLAVVADRAVGRGILDQRANRGAIEPERVGIGDDDVDPACGGARPDHRDRLRMTVVVDQVGQLPPPLVLRDGLRQVHRFGGGGPFVEQ